MTISSFQGGGVGKNIHNLPLNQSALGVLGSGRSPAARMASMAQNSSLSEASPLMPT
jgi:hypothetical protein